MPQGLVFAARLLIAFALCLPMAARADQKFEGATNRPGSDIISIPLEPSIAGAAICRGLCIKNGECNSWTMVVSGIQGPKAVCWLKRGVPQAVPDKCCESGVVRRSVEPNMDRPGSDFFSGQQSGNYDECQRFCKTKPECRAWTYVKDTGPGTVAYCWLKNTVPDAVANPGTISGVR